MPHVQEDQESIETVLAIIRWLATVAHAALLLFSGWEIGACWVAGSWFGIVAFAACFAMNVSGLRAVLLRW